MSEPATTATPRAVTEWIRVWAHEVPLLEQQGWRFSHALMGGPGELLYGLEFRDCWLMREVPRV